jgi:hypothetical protein
MASKKQEIVALSLTVRHPASEGEETEGLEDVIDGDGHLIEYVTWKTELSPVLVEVGIMPGQSARIVAAVLRKLADRLERQGDRFLAPLEEDVEGTFNANGELAEE